MKLKAFCIGLFLKIEGCGVGSSCIWVDVLL